MSFRFVVEDGKVAEFAKAVRDDNPAHRDRAAAEEQGFAGIPAPLTFVSPSPHSRRRPSPLPPQTLSLTRSLPVYSHFLSSRPLLARPLLPAPSSLSLLPSHFFSL